MPFTPENFNINQSVNSQFQVGVSNVDPDGAIERDIKIPWTSDPKASWLYFDCAIGAMLDSGIVVHNRLPQVNRLPDSLSSAYIDDPQLDAMVGPGVNIRSLDQYQDIVQRMGHSRYWFRLWGQAIRAGHQVPIPGIRLIGGVPAIPYDKNPQWAFNRMVPGGNLGGVVLWHAQWSLWYTTTVPPSSSTIPAADPSAHINSTTPGDVQVPYSLPDDNARTSSPIQPNQPSGRLFNPTL